MGLHLGIGPHRRYRGLLRGNPAQGVGRADNDGKLPAGLPGFDQVTARDRPLPCAVEGLPQHRVSEGGQQRQGKPTRRLPLVVTVASHPQRVGSVAGDFHGFQGSVQPVGIGDVIALGQQPPARIQDLQRRVQVAIHRLDDGGDPLSFAGLKLPAQFRSLAVERPEHGFHQPDGRQLAILGARRSRPGWQE